MLHFQTAATGYRLDSQLSAPHRFMTLGSWTCKAGPPSRYRHIFLKLPNRRSFYLLTISIKTNTPLAEVGQAKQPLPQARRWLLEICGARPVSTCTVHDFVVVHVIACLLFFNLFRLATRNGSSHCIGPKKNRRLGPPAQCTVWKHITLCDSTFFFNFF